jgi:hypothetical protein
MQPSMNTYFSFLLVLPRNTEGSGRIWIRKNHSGSKTPKMVFRILHPDLGPDLFFLIIPTQGTTLKLDIKIERDLKVRYCRMDVASDKLSTFK